MQQSADPDLMRYWHDAPKRRGDVVTIPILWLTLILSLLIHIAALWEVLPKLPLLNGEKKELPSIAEERLAVRLMPQVQQPSTPSAPAPRVQGTPSAPATPASPPPPKPRAQKPPTQTPPAPSPPVVATAPPTQSRPALPPPTPEKPTLPPAPAPPSPSISPPTVAQDLASYIAARRAARGEPDAPASNAPAPPVPTETDAERRNRIVAANLASLNTPTFGTEPRNSGGIFQIRRLGYDDAEFTFYGWNKDIKRRTSQKIEVRRGNNSDIRVAVVRRIIEVIRDYEQEDFNWSSQRLGHVVVLSARPADNAGLESFMMEEFFSVQQR
ncbi:MAG TPA: hypothetical protein VFJ68_14090 [Casimicrobiaceae bacterium]|nr:hypothetical protein [Casimicrobiaceae bacterium]